MIIITIAYAEKGNYCQNLATTVTVDENASEMVVYLNIECTCTHAAPAPLQLQCIWADNTMNTGTVTKRIRGEVSCMRNVVHTLVRIYQNL